VRKLLLSLSVISTFLFLAAPASAATILFDACTGEASLCGHMSLTTTLVGSDINVNVEGVGGDYGIFGDTGNMAFGLNVNGSGVTFSNLTPGFAYTGSGGSMPSYGLFEYLFSGPHTGSGALLPFEFTVSRAGGFASDLDLFETNAGGFLAAAHLRNNDTGVTGFVAATPGNDNTPVPEPGTMVLLGSGLVAAYRARRNRHASC
jgi:hypothetical protein